MRRIHREGIERGDGFLGGHVVDGLGTELLADVRVDTHLLDPLDVAGPRPETESVKDVGGLLAFAETIRGRWVGFARMRQKQQYLQRGQKAADPRTIRSEHGLIPMP